MFKDPVLNKNLKEERCHLSHPKKHRKHYLWRKVLIAPTNEWERLYKICKEFKRNFWDKKPEERIAELKRLSKIIIKNKNSYDRLRKKKHPIYKPCWVCRKERAFYPHHIILLKNGGYDNGINRIPICNDCHEKIHPFMKEKKEGFPRE